LAQNLSLIDALPIILHEMFQLLLDGFMIIEIQVKRYRHYTIHILLSFQAVLLQIEQKISFITDGLVIW
jgi:hypothetical protein